MLYELMLKRYLWPALVVMNLASFFAIGAWRGYSGEDPLLAAVGTGLVWMGGIAIIGLTIGSAIIGIDRIVQEEIAYWKRVQQDLNK